MNQELFYWKFHQHKTESMHESSLYLPINDFLHLDFFFSHSVLGYSCSQLLVLAAQNLLSLLSITASHLRAVKINDLQQKMVNLIIHQFPKDCNCISILCGSLQLACCGTWVLSCLVVTSTDDCVGAQARGSSRDCQGWLGWEWEWEQRCGRFVSLKRAEMSRFAAIRGKVCVEEMTTAVFHQSKISLVRERNSLGLMGVLREIQLPLQGTFFPLKTDQVPAFGFDSFSA